MHVEHDRDAHRFFATIDGQIARLEYEVVGPHTLDYYSTFVPPPLRGRGIASELARRALDYARENDKRVIPSCWFVRKIIETDPKYGAIAADI